MLLNLYPIGLIWVPAIVLFITKFTGNAGIAHIKFWGNVGFAH